MSCSDCVVNFKWPILLMAVVIMLIFLVLVVLIWFADTVSVQAGGFVVSVLGLALSCAVIALSSKLKAQECECSSSSSFSSSSFSSPAPSFTNSNGFVAPTGQMPVIQPLPPGSPS